MKLVENYITDTTDVFVTRDKPQKSFFRKETPKKIYVKSFNPAEFIGEELASIKNIRCAHYFIVGLGRYKLDRNIPYGLIKDNDSIRIQIGSHNFEDPRFKYKELEDYDLSIGETPMDAMLKHTPTEENRRQLCMDILNMFALDIYMGQVDRYSYNYQFEEDIDHNIRLAPLFDFEQSMSSLHESKVNFHPGELYRFNTLEDCRKFIHEYPMFRDILSSYLHVDLKEVIKRAYDKRNMIVPEERMEFYDKFENSRDEIIERIVK